jgi:serine phosphatase RsbU (regulator of sigma subunit)
MIVLVADVSGHGVQAALTSMLLKAIFRESASGADGPEELLRAMNTPLHAFMPSGMYACGAILWFGGSDSKVHITNAGLPYPFLLSRAEKRTDEVPLAGMPLGLFEQAMPGGYDSRELQLDSGDVLIVASDGIGDIQGKDQRMFQDGELKKALSELHGKDGQEVIETLMKRAGEFSAGETYPDDVTLVTVTKT